MGAEALVVTLAAQRDRCAVAGRILAARRDLRAASWKKDYAEAEIGGLRTMALDFGPGRRTLPEYADEIPVVMIDGQVHTIWRVDADRLRTALT